MTGHRHRSQSIQKKVINRIYGKGRGWCFTPKNFLDLGTRFNIDIILSRLVGKGVIRRLARGLYEYPKKHSAIGLLSPNPNDVATALKEREATRLQPSGAYAANMLGLSEQVPAQIVFLTDGPSRRVQIGEQEIRLKKTTPRNMALAGKASGTVIQALRHIGKNQVSSWHIKHLQRTLSPQDKQQLKRDRVNAPAWMHSIINQIVEDQHD